MIDNNFEFNEMFEKKLAEYTGFKYAVATDCCTNAMLISLRAKQILGEVFELECAKNTYLSIPMMLKNNGFKFKFKNERWVRWYELGDSGVIDGAVNFQKSIGECYDDSEESVFNMNRLYDKDICYCVSFQQKKRLSLGRGGAILTNNEKYVKLLKRLRHSGRDNFMVDKDEIYNNPDNIILGYHCYMEPDKAAKGILMLNQADVMLKPYEQKSFLDYPDVSPLRCFK